MEHINLTKAVDLNLPFVQQEIKALMYLEAFLKNGKVLVQYLDRNPECFSFAHVEVYYKNRLYHPHKWEHLYKLLYK